MISTINYKHVLIGIFAIFAIYFLFKKDDIDNNDDQVNLTNVQNIPDTFWTNVIKIENDQKNIYQYQLPQEFNVNPKFLIYHPNFTLSPTKMVQIISKTDNEATAMLNLWVSLNKGLLDQEENFSQLFETSIRRALNYPSVVHKFKTEITNMVHFDTQPHKPDNLEFTEDLALNEVLYQNPPENKETNNQFGAINSGGEALASF